MPKKDKANTSNAKVNAPSKQNYAEDFKPYERIINIGGAASLDDTQKRLLKYNESILVVYPTIAGSICNRVRVVCAIRKAKQPCGVPELSYEMINTNDEGQSKKLAQILQSFLTYKERLMTFEEFSSANTDTAGGLLPVIKNGKITGLTPEQIKSTSTDWSQITLIDIVNANLIAYATDTLQNMKDNGRRDELFNTKFKKEKINYIGPDGKSQNVNKSDVKKLLFDAWSGQKILNKKQLTDILMFVIQNKTGNDYMYEPEQLRNETLQQKYNEFITTCFGEGFVQESADQTMIDDLKSNDIKNVIFVDEKSCSDENANIWNLKVGEKLIIFDVNAKDIYTFINTLRGVALAADKLDKDKAYTLTAEKINYEKTLEVTEHSIDYLTSEQKKILRRKTNELARYTYDNYLTYIFYNELNIQTGDNTTHIEGLTLPFCATHDWTKDYDYEKNIVTEAMIENAENALKELYNELNSTSSEKEITNKLKAKFTQDLLPLYLDYNNGTLNPFNFSQSESIQNICKAWYGNRKSQDPKNVLSYCVESSFLDDDQIRNSFIYVLLSCNYPSDTFYTLPFYVDNPIYKKLMKAARKTIGRETSLLGKHKAGTLITETLKQNGIKHVRIIGDALDYDSDKIRGIISDKTKEKTVILFKSGGVSKVGEWINILREIASAPDTLNLPLTGQNEYTLSDDAKTLIENSTLGTHDMDVHEKNISITLLQAIQSSLKFNQTWQVFSEKPNNFYNVKLENGGELELNGKSNQELSTTNWRHVLETSKSDTKHQITIEQIKKTGDKLRGLQKSPNLQEIQTTSQYYYTKTEDDIQEHQVSFKQAETIFTNVWDGNGENCGKDELNGALMYAISAINETDNLFLPSKSNRTSDDVRQAYNELYAEIFTATKEEINDENTEKDINDPLINRLKTYGNKIKELNPPNDLLRIKKQIRTPIKYINIDGSDSEGSDDSEKINLKNAKSQLHAIFEDTKIKKLKHRPLAALCKILKDNRNASTAKTIITKYYIHELHKFAKKRKDTAPMCQAIERIIFNRWGLKRKRDKVKTFFKREKT